MRDTPTERIEKIAQRTAGKHEIVQLTMRISKPVRDKVGVIAIKHGLSINELCAAIIEDVVEGKDPL